MDLSDEKESKDITIAKEMLYTVRNSWMGEEWTIRIYGDSIVLKDDLENQIGYFSALEAEAIGKTLVKAARTLAKQQKRKKELKDD